MLICWPSACSDLSEYTKKPTLFQSFLFKFVEWREWHDSDISIAIFNQVSPT